jgi:eukaryotic-like serine/threonine-protein kinase
MLAKEPAVRPTIKEVTQTLGELQAPDKISVIAPVWKRAIATVLLVLVSLAGWRWKLARDAGKAPSFRQITTLVPENRATAAAISPDGKLGAYANVDGIFVRSIQNGETKTLSAPADYVVDQLAWFADGAKLVASGFSATTYIPSIWLIAANGGLPRLLRTNARLGSPSPDGRCVAFVTKDCSELWVIGARGEDARKLASGRESDRFELVFWFANGGRIGFQRHYYSDTGDERRYESVSLGNPKFLSRGPDLRMNSATALRDGRLMFLKWDPDDTSSQELWEVKTDLSSGAVLGKPRMLAKMPGDSTSLLDLSVARDGNRAMVLRRSDQRSVFVGDFNEAPPRISNIRRLTFDERTSYPHAWTADSRAVIFESDRNGSYDLFKQYLNRHTPDTIVATPYTEMLPQLAPDGHFVLYAARPHEDQQPWYYKPGTYKLMRVPVDGGLPEEVPIGGPLDEFRCAVGLGKRCVLRTTQPAQFRTYYDLDPIRGKGRELARTKWSIEVLGDWDVSPDGTQVAIPNHDSREARIRVVSLEPKRNEPREREILLQGLTDISGLIWAADGGGWFVSLDTTVGNRLLYVYLDGHFEPLGDIQGWAVPSPDGRRVAFLDRIIATNAWLIERH